MATNKSISMKNILFRIFNPNPIHETKTISQDQKSKLQMQAE